MAFQILHKEKHTRARTGLLQTTHGTIETPVFMPVGTQATVKSLDSEDLHKLGAQIILGNTYHLHLRPGEDLIAERGGLHGFMQWDKPMLTDSGGFQVFSLGNATTENEHEKLVQIDDEGVTFRSYIDGSEHRFSPETAIDIQHKLGADIIMAFDECTKEDVSEKDAANAMARTHAWAKRCIDHHKASKSTQQLFGIVQGGKFEHLRKASAEYISSLPFDGIAIGGESIGYHMQTTREVLEYTIPLIPEDKPHYTMGLGHSPMDIFDVVERGVDMFDCVSPTRMARNGGLFITPETRNALGTQKHMLNIKNAQFRNDPLPIDPHCTFPGHEGYSRAYLHHLFAANELLAYRIATLHNLHFLMSLMKQIRDAITNDTLRDLKKKWT